ncbi:MAG TPA: DUF1707 domain-containing protein [Pseudonocardiaceae bacterium]|nr:DUF1707 domain-containing protein [Pseudonocardiaceae bacterium]
MGEEDGGRDLIRASDADRTAVADRLRAAVDEGRLTITEYDDRLRSAYEAVTYGDLAALTRDLPPTPVVADAVPAVPAGTAPVSVAARLLPLRRWLAANLIFLVIWGGSSIAAGHLVFFWPAFILLWTGLGPLRRALRHDSNG